MSLPALRALREEHPETRITILARPWVADLYGRESFCDQVLPWGGYRWAAIHDLRRQQFEAAVLLQNAFGAAAVAALAGIPRRIGYNRDARGWLLTDAIRVPRPGEIPPHQSFYYLELLRRAGLVTKPLPAEPLVRLEGRTTPTQPTVGVSPGAAFGGAKRWLPERFADSAIEIAGAIGARVWIFGTREEQPIAAEVTSRVSGAGLEVEDFCGRTSLREFIDRAGACTVFLTNDSGSMHIASALGVPTVTVFGATDHIATGPTGPLARIVREPVDCSPCHLRECPIDHRCMTRVSSTRVAGVALDLLK
jgi:heptosyltransferase-2